MTESFLPLDGDVIPRRASLSAFLARAGRETTIGIAPVNSEDVVFVRLDRAGRIASFSRTERSPYEWSNIAVIAPGVLADENAYVFERLEKFLPLHACHVERLEIDTPNDICYVESVLSDPEYGYAW